jgi:hypothetical protein
VGLAAYVVVFQGQGMSLSWLVHQGASFANADNPELLTKAGACTAAYPPPYRRCDPSEARLPGLQSDGDTGRHMDCVVATDTDSVVAGVQAALTHRPY